ncbi:hypothetical protein [Rossellomorea vietnamensis]|uniref:Uncharacterized protein n=1 Tax=Rossellomorea vietnamensis TaxID=218284 RepID=A0ACD4C6J6_9BACI|nr:hypothetical protein [Rossellomorea vietnamensis]UXH44280.1 hypothetical protein N5C46_22065 [Rossellomorea vietnamensis]WQI95675.1 hypothetical protein Q7C14_22285 [Rossellomorea vietnamensis]
MGGRGFNMAMGGNPAVFDEKPAEIGKNPAGLRHYPAVMVENPAEIQQNPAELHIYLKPIKRPSPKQKKPGGKSHQTQLFSHFPYGIRSAFF